MTPAEMAARRSVFLTSSRDLLQPVPEIADSVLAQLIDLHIADMLEVGKALRRSKICEVM